MNHTAPKSKGILRWVPVSTSEPAKVCGWLEDMAEQGYILKNNGIRFGFASFEQKSPRRLHYCADAAPTEHSLFSKDWHYCATYKDYNIHVSEAAQPGVLHEHPDIALDAWKKKERSSWIALFTASLTALCTSLPLWKNSFFATIANSEWLLFFLFYAFCYTMTLHARFIISIHRIRKSLKQSIGVPTTIPGKLYKALHCSVFFLTIALLLGTLVYFVIELNFRPNTVAQKPDIPLATVSYPTTDWSIIPAEQEEYDYEESHGFLYPCSYRWVEHGTLLDPEGTDYPMSIWVSYHEARTPWLAQQLAEEYYEKEQEYGWPWDVDLSDLNLDRGWVKSRGDPYFILQKGKTLAFVRFYPSYSEDFPPELLTQWAHAIASTLEG